MNVPATTTSTTFVAAAKAWLPKRSPHERDAGAIAAEQVGACLWAPARHGHMHNVS